MNVYYNQYYNQYIFFNDDFKCWKFCHLIFNIANEVYMNKKEKILYFNKFATTKRLENRELNKVTFFICLLVNLKENF